MSEQLMQFFTPERVMTAVRVAVLVLVGIPLVRVVGFSIEKIFKKRSSAQTLMLLKKGIVYFGYIVILMMCLKELGFHITTLLGAAGIAGVAIGFASQTSLSNLISGLFLVAEKPFMVGDVLKVGDITGVVQNIDLLSVKIRAFDNTYVRIPNEDLIKSRFTNITRYPIRRLDIEVGVAYKEDIPKVLKLLEEIARDNPFCLDEPKPLILFKGFGSSSLDFLFGVWFAKEDVLELRNTIHRDIKARFDAENIEIPFPHLTVYAGAVTDPFPVRVENSGRP